MKRGFALLLAGLLLWGLVPGALAQETSADPFILRAVSWGPMVQDHATMRYFLENANDRFTGWQGDAPNAWLRLDATGPAGALEALSDFRVVKGRAVCGQMPVPLPDLDAVSMDWRTLYFAPHQGFSRAALDIRLEAGEEINNLTIACTRKHPDDTEETITLPLSGLPMDMGYPAGGAAFRATRFSPFTWREEDINCYLGYSILPATLGNMLRYYAYMPILDAPEALLSQLIEIAEGKLYLIEGFVSKKKGDFGLYDLTFALENPPEGMWLAPYQVCGNCSEIDAFDLGYNARTGEEARERRLAILLLVQPGDRSEEEIDELIRGLQITVSFSGEKWDISGEQHGTTSGIGPRSQERLEMKDIQKAEAVHSLD